MGTFGTALVKQAQHGNTEAQYKLALQYCILNSPRLAEHWFYVAAMHGHHKAKVTLYEFKQRGLFSTNVSAATLRNN